MSSHEPNKPSHATSPESNALNRTVLDPAFGSTVVEGANPLQLEATGTIGFGSSGLGAVLLQETAREEDFFQPDTLGETLLAKDDELFLEGQPLVEALQQSSNPAKRSTILPKARIYGEVPTLHMAKQERYEQLQPLGEGAAGEVLLAKDNDIQRLVAVKRLKKQQHAPTSLVRFVEEIQTIGKLEHPNIVPIHDVGIDENGQYYFIMKYVEGETLGSIIERLQAGDPEAHKAYPFEERNMIFFKVLQAVQFAHEQGIIHRDLKPENIMIGSCGQVMVMDWGLAKRIRQPLCGSAALPSEAAPPVDAINNENAHSAGATNDPERMFATRVGTLIGTPAYMPPEQALGQIDQLDERSDIYSLSALYYELMTLKHYLGHKTNIKDLLWGILEETPQFPAFSKHEHQSNVPAEFSHYVMKGLEKQPGDRYQSIAEMEFTLRAAMAGKFAVQCPITMMKRGGSDTLRLIDRFPFAALGATILLIVLLIAGGVQIGSWVIGMIGA
jgi:serine/threonine-protein kinase